MIFENAKEWKDENLYLGLGYLGIDKKTVVFWD